MYNVEQPFCLSQLKYMLYKPILLLHSPPCFSKEKDMETRESRKEEEDKLYLSLWATSTEVRGIEGQEEGIHASI